MSNIIGYARMSTREQSPEAQEAELTTYGGVRVFTDRGESSRVADRPKWLACLDYLRAGDTPVIRKLDRIAGSEVMAIQTIAELHDRGVQINVDRGPLLKIGRPAGRLMTSASAPPTDLQIVHDGTCAS